MLYEKIIRRKKGGRPTAITLLICDEETRNRISSGVIRILGMTDLLRRSGDPKIQKAINAAARAIEKELRIR